MLGRRSSCSKRQLWCLLLLVIAVLGTRPSARSWAGPSSLQPVSEATTKTKVRSRTVPRGSAILFVGNSYTYYAKMPKFFERLLAAGDRRMKIDSATGPGLFFRDHLANPKTMARVDSGDYAFIVFQAQSLAPLETREDFLASGQRLVRRAQKAGAKVLLFETWARAPGHPYYNDPDSGGAPAEMQARLSAGYDRLHRATGARVLPIGRVMTEAVATSVSRTPLFDSDGTHPSLVGAYLAAMVVYGQLTGQCAPLLKSPPKGLPLTEAKALRAVAGRHVGFRCPQ